MSDFLYPFDPTGTNPANLVQNEVHTLSPVTWKDYHFVIPTNGPFFRDSLTIYDLNAERFLVEGVDFYYTHKFISASRATAKDIYGSFTFLNRAYAGAIRINYQTLGGDWSIDSGTITEILMDALANPRVTAWEQIVTLPFQFPVIDHEWNLTDMVGVKEVKEAIDEVKQALLDRFAVAPSLATHIANKANPHDVTKGHVGLGSVQNFPMATLAQALDGIYDDAYMSPRRTRQAIEKFAYAYVVERLEEYYTKDEINSLLTNYYNKGEVYPIEQTYTRAEVDAAINAAIAAHLTTLHP